MANINNNLLNELAAKLLTTGAVEFNKDGLNIKASYNNGCLNIYTSFESPKEDNTEKLIAGFEEYVDSLSDEFFIEICESFEPGELKKIQDKIDSKKPTAVIEGIHDFMSRLKVIASHNVEELNKDIEANQKELDELINIRESYIHALNKKF